MRENRGQSWEATVGQIGHLLLVLTSILQVQQTALSWSSLATFSSCPCADCVLVADQQLPQTVLLPSILTILILDKISW